MVDSGDTQYNQRHLHVKKDMKARAFDKIEDETGGLWQNYQLRNSTKIKMCPTCDAVIRAPVSIKRTTVFENPTAPVDI